MWQASSMLEMIERDAPSYGVQADVGKFDFNELVERREKYIDFYMEPTTVDLIIIM